MDLRRTLAPTCALAALSAAVAAGFARVIAGDAWVAAVLGAAIAPHAIALVTRTRSIAVTIGAWVGGLGAYVLWGLLLSTTKVGIPTGRTLDVFSHRLDAGLLALRNNTAPVAPRPGVILLAVLAVWVMAAFADHLAFRRDASIGALAPGITLFIWIAALAPTSDSPVGAAVAIVITGAAFLALQHQLLLARRRGAIGSEARFPAPHLVLGAVALATAAAIIAVALAPALPGAGADPLVDLRNDDRGSSTYQTSVPPLIDVADSLRRGDQVQVFTVAAASPEYWRTVALDNYSDKGGGQWTLRAAGGDITHGLHEEPTGPTVTQQYRIGALDERWMPAAFEPVSVSLDDTLVVESSRTLVTNEDAVEGLQYKVVSQPPPSDLTESQRRATGAAPPAQLARYTEVPSSLPASVAKPRDVTQGATTAYDKARLLRDYFHGPQFTYDPGVNLTDEVNATVTFLNNKHGFCVQFASTYALMARTLGIPARVAVGYTPGELDPATGQYSVTNYEAHAWPEVWLTGVGWTNQFDPTPPSTQPGGSDLPHDTAAVAPITQTPSPTTPQTTPQTAPPDTGVPNATPAPAPAPNAAPVSTSNSGRSWTTSVLWALLVFGVVAALIAAVPLAKHARRRARQRRSDPTGRVAGAWEEAVDRLRELGRPAPRTNTPAEHARSATKVVGEPAAASLAALADAHTVAQFSAEPATAADADAAWHVLDAFTDALGRHLPVTTRLRARLRVAPLRRPRAAVDQVDQADPVNPANQLEPVGASAARSSSTND